MATPTLVTGDDLSFPTVLRKKPFGSSIYSTFSIDPGATIFARLVSTDRENVYTPEIAQVTDEQGADLANSLIIIAFTSAETIDIAHQGGALLEVQVDDGGKLTWFASVRINRGQIE